MLFPALTLVHVLISLAAIAYGFTAVFAMIAGRIPKSINSWFLVTTILTSITGFVLPARQFLPSHALGIISLVVLAVAGAGYWKYALEGAWRKIYVIGAWLALYLNVFVLVVQLFRHVPPLTQLAPTQTEPAFQLAQLATLIAMLTIGVRAYIGIKNQPGATASAAA